MKRKEILKKLRKTGRFTFEEGGRHTKVYENVVFKSLIGRHTEIPENTVRDIEEQTGVKLR